MFKPDGDRLVPPGVIELVAPVGGQDHFQTEPLRSIREHANLVPGRRCQQ
jgi:hypothetical protein